MSNFISDFFENRGWLGLVQQNPTTGALEAGGTAISNSRTIATIPDAASVAPGSIINLPRSEFTTSTAATVPGMAEDGIYLKSSDGVWIPAFSQVFSQAYGTKAAPLASLSTSSATKIEITLPSGNPIIPLEIYAYVGFNIQVEFLFGSLATLVDTTVMSARFGWSATYKDNCQVAWQQISAGATNRSMYTVGRARILAYASAASNTVSLDRNANNVVSAGNTGYVDTANTQDFTKDAYLSFSWEPTVATAATGCLYGYKMILS